MVSLLAQIFPPAPSHIEPLPGPPLLESALFERPIYPAIGLAIAAVILFLLLNQRGKARQGALAAGGLVAIAVGLLILGSTITTEREQMTSAVRALVDATAATDRAGLDRLLAPDARLYSQTRIPDGPAIAPAGLDKPAIINAAASAFAEHPLKDHIVQEVQAQSTGPGIGLTQVRVWVSFDVVPNTSWWRINWRKSPDGQWRATAIEPIDLGWAGR